MQADVKINTMKAGFFQFSPAFGRKEENLSKTAEALSRVSAEALGRVNADAPDKACADLMVLPEFFATGYLFESTEEAAALSEPVPNGPTTDFLAGLSRDMDMYIVAGLPEIDADGRLFNSAVLTGPKGFVGLYRKTHLFCDEKRFFTPGDTGFRVFKTPVGNIGIMICFDWFFPESTRTLALMGADVVAHPSNLVLPHCPGAMPVRSLENRIFTVTANRTGTERRPSGRELTFIGQSIIATPGGKTLAKAPEMGDALEARELDLDTARDKSINDFNDVLKDRRPEFYE